jgi:CelD/BcsL family acetyltransferase involved in cellulose biosynthesis
MIRFEVLPPSVPLESLQSDWDRLYRESGREPSVSYAWSRAIIRNHLAGRDNWFIVVLKRGDRIAGIVPMMTNRERLFGRPIVTLQPVQEKNNTHSDLLLADHSRELLLGWLDALVSQKGRWDLLRMTRLLEHSPLAERLTQEVNGRRQLGCRWRLERPSFYLKLPASYAEYLSLRSGKLRNYLKRAEKKLAAEGAVDFVRVRNEAEFQQHYEHLLSIERDSWKHEHGTAISAVSHQEGFYRDLAEVALQSGMLHLTFLRVAGVPIAYNLGLVSGDCYFYLKTSYRQQYRAHGAASIGRARLVEQVIAEGCTALDFPGEPYEWEQQWTDDVRWHRSLLLFNGTLAGRALSLVMSARNLLRPQREERRIVFCDPRALRAGEAGQ